MNTLLSRGYNIGRCRIRFCCDTRGDRPEAGRGSLERSARATASNYKFFFFERSLKYYSKYITNARQLSVKKEFSCNVYKKNTFPEDLKIVADLERNFLDIFLPMEYLFLKENVIECALNINLQICI